MNLTNNWQILISVRSRLRSSMNGGKSGRNIQIGSKIEIKTKSGNIALSSIAVISVEVSHSLSRCRLFYGSWCISCKLYTIMRAYVSVGKLLFTTSLTEHPLRILVLLVLSE